MSKTYEQFQEECKAPVDLEACRAAISRIAQGRLTMRVPVQIDDDDILLSRAINELERARHKADENQKNSQNHLTNRNALVW